MVEAAATQNPTRTRADAPAKRIGFMYPATIRPTPCAPRRLWSLIRTERGRKGAVGLFRLMSMAQRWTQLPETRSCPLPLRGCVAQRLRGLPTYGGPRRRHPPYVAEPTYFFRCSTPTLVTLAFQTAAGSHFGRSDGATAFSREPVKT